MKKIILLLVLFNLCIAIPIDPFENKVNTKPIKKTVKKTLQIEKKLVTANYLKAIIGDYVFINDKWVKIGESVNGYEIKEIHNNHIVVSKENKQKNIKIDDVF